ncbi:head GIN domain-containing protein [Aureitalea marina]|uniref:DUF2807 domain-containing protein n=1 Tax=Aureitalea marina TaxID=930804 RepID=A0A2S7KNT3_9FLAO|nr:head GIN domain-containing protein [Aureitalea marina]PQB04294.1 DUF2807 domain-containing protein [Aureitalea marina]
MKTTIKTILCTLLIVGGTSSVFAQWGSKKVTGNGNVTTKTVNTGSYDAVKGVGSMDIHLERGTEGAVQVTTDDNLHEYLDIQVKGSSLVIATKKGYNLKTKKGIHVTVPFQDISEVALTGSGDIDTKDTIDSQNMAISVTGSGDVILDINSGKAKVRVTGSGDIELSGKTVDLDLAISGSGDYKGFGLEAQNTDVSISGSGDAKVVANSSIIARVAGSGDIEYRGNPEQSDTKASGSGSITSNN